MNHARMESGNVNFVTMGFQTWVSHPCHLVWGNIKLWNLVLRVVLLFDIGAT